VRSEGYKREGDVWEMEEGFMSANQLCTLEVMYALIEIIK